MYVEIIVWNWEEEETTSGIEDVSVFNLGKNITLAKQEFEQDKNDLSTTNAKIYLRYIGD